MIKTVEIQSLFFYIWHVRAKWYLGILTVILVLSGLREQHTPPNQEIVLQFANETVTLDKVQSAIAEVESQLQNIGVTNIQIGETKNGILKIAYFSDIDIDAIKNELSKEDHLQLKYTNNNQDNHSESPSEQSTNDYDFDVFEIQNNYDVKSEIEGYLIDYKPESDLLVNSNNSNALYNEFAILIKNDADALAYNIYKNVTLVLDHISDKIPEGRAGPTS